MTPELIAAWTGFAVAIIGAIGTIAYKAAKASGDQSNASQVSYLIIDAKAAQAMSESMGALAASLTRVSRTLDAVVDGQERTQRALGVNSESADRVHDAATELRIAMADLTGTIRNAGLPRR